MSNALSNPSLKINSDAIFVRAGTVTYTEGFGEGSVTNQSAGGGIIDQIDNDDVSTEISMVKFSMANTIANIKLARSWKAAGAKNSIGITQAVSDGNFKRNFAGMKLVNDYEVPLQSDADIELEFRGRRATV